MALPLLSRLVAVVALLTAGVVARSELSAGANTPLPDPYAITPAVDTNPAPTTFETTLVAKPATIDIGNGVTANMWSYNGTVPGPEIRVRVGDTVIVHFRNELPLASAIHWHGIELNNANDGSELTQNAVPPGGSFLYKFIVPRPGIFWYHPHLHAQNQVFRGLYGSLIVTDAHDDTLVANGVLPPRHHTKTLMLSDTTICKEPGSNDTDTYDDSLPWSGGGPLPEQPAPFPADLCERPWDDHGFPILDENGEPVPLQAGDIANILQPPAVPGVTLTVRTNEGQIVLTNGRNSGHRNGSPEAPGPVAPGAATLDVSAGQGLRFQAVNTANSRYFRLRLTDAAGAQLPLVRVGGQGGLLDVARVEGGRTEGTAGIAQTQYDTKYARGEIVLAPSERVDLVVAVPQDAAPGVATLWTLDYFHVGGPRFAFVPTVPVMHLNVTEPAGEAYSIAEGTPLRTHPDIDDPIETLGPPRGLLPDMSGISPLLDPASFDPPKEGSAEENIRLTHSIVFTSIDNVVVKHDRGVDYTAVPHTRVSRYARLGDLLELTVTNTTTAHHPFHLHGFSFQPLGFERMTNRPFDAEYTFDHHEFVDVIDVPGQYTLRFRVRLDDRPLMDGTTPGGGIGRWMFHCHIFFHATLGMQSELVIVAPDGNEKPNVNVDATSVAVDEGGPASTTGAFSDPDGDPVTLTASTGTVADSGGGRWSWQAGSGAPPGSRTVHITATDADGLKSQAAFDLDVANTAPDLTVTEPTSGSSVPVGSTVTVAATVTDLGANSLWCRFDWDDGEGAGPVVAVENGRCSDARTIGQPGVRTIVVTATDGEGTDGDATVVAVHDPNGGFVTGSGTTDSGQAGFDLAAKYLKGATVPVGKVAFTSADMEFAATEFRWLVVARPRAQMRGSGSVGGIGGYEFLLTVIDGNGQDRLRLKVWKADTGTVVFDNAAGNPDDMDTANPPPITLGNIVMHR